LQGEVKEEDRDGYNKALLLHVRVANFKIRVCEWDANEGLLGLCHCGNVMMTTYLYTVEQSIRRVKLLYIIRLSRILKESWKVVTV